VTEKSDFASAATRAVILIRSSNPPHPPTSSPVLFQRDSPPEFLPSPNRCPTNQRVQHEAIQSHGIMAFMQARHAMRVEARTAMFAGAAESSG